MFVRRKKLEAVEQKLRKTRQQRDRARAQREQLRDRLQRHQGREAARSGSLEQQCLEAARDVNFLRQAMADLETQRLQLAAELHTARKALADYESLFAKANYHADSLIVWGKSVDFLDDPKFRRAYAAGIYSGHQFKIPGSEDPDIHIEWRMHVALWAARWAASLPGDFVECGVNTGMMSLAICHDLDFNLLSKRFWLFDTYCGLPDEQISQEERAMGLGEYNKTYYPDCFARTSQNFAPFSSARLVRGKVPDSLRTVDIGQVCYLSIDMNLAEPEIAALRHFWDRLVPGAPVLLDDYGFATHRAQKKVMDEFAAEKNLAILALPTGQGLVLKPHGA